MPEITNFVFEIEGLSDKLHVARFECTEEISSLYRLEVAVACEDHDLDFDGLVGKPALLTLTAADQDEVRRVHGIVSDLEQGAEGKRLSFYRVSVVPEAWQLDQIQDIRIFQDMTTPAIIEKVWGDAEMSHSTLELRLEASYRTHEYRVQYRESDWAFIMRLMEEEGIYCFFEHQESSHKLIVGDSPAAHDPIAGDPSLRFRPDGGAIIAGEHIAEFRYRQRIRPGKVTLCDYNFKKPDLDISGDASGSAHQSLEVYDYPGEYREPPEGKNLAKLRLQHHQAERKIAWGRSGCTRLTSGHTFELAEHPRTSFNQSYMLTRVEHQGVQPIGDHSDVTMEYTSRVQCIPSDVPYRPPHRTPKPKIYGVQTAIVVGPAGEEIYPDEHGRVKVQFHWDRVGKKDEKSSCWIRVSQLWAGAGWGAMQIPRIGHEVVVDFLEGDPDQPLIVGRVYHGKNLPPYRLPAEKTKSTIKSETTPGGGGYNELMFEDNKGAEEIYLHGQKDWTILIENDKNQTVGHDETLKVGNNRDKTVGNDQSETIGGNKTITVKGTHTEKISMAESVTVGLASAHTIGGAFVESIGAAKQSTVAGASSESVGAAKVVKIGGTLSETVGGKASASIGGNKELTVAEKYQLTVEKDMTTAVKANASEKVDKNKSINVGEVYSLVVGDGKITVKKDGTILVEGKDITVKGTGKITVKAAKKIDITTDATLNVKASGAIKVKGSAVDVN